MARKKKEVVEAPKSELILGYARLRVTGKSGDAMAPYPRIADLSMIELLPEDDQDVLRQAMAVVLEAQTPRPNRPARTVIAITELATPTTPAASQTLKRGEFNPAAFETVIVPFINGG
jgi:hypothetical protein